MDWTVVLVAAAGVAGTLVGTVLAPIITASQDQRSWLRQRRVELYSDALVHAEAAERLRWRLIDEFDSGSYSVGGMSEPVSADLISARMSLYGDAEVRKAWSAFTLAWDRLKFRVEEDHPEGGVTLPLDHPGIQELHTATDELSKVCRRQVVGR